MQNRTYTSNTIQPPAIGEFLPSAISKAVKRTALTHPVTLYPLAVGAGTGVIALLFKMPVLFGVTLAGVLIGILWSIIQIFFLHDRIGGRYTSELNKRHKDYQNHVKALLETELESCRTMAGAEEFVEQGLSHFRQIEEKLNSVNALLDLKVHTTEITYGRFAGAAEQVALAVLNNLKDIVAILKSSGSIDTDYIQARLKALSRQPETVENIQQRDTLMLRIDLKKRQFGKINRLLSKNETAMTEMEKISAALSEWNEQEGFTDSDFESAIVRLQELAEQAHHYNKI